MPFKDIVLSIDFFSSLNEEQINLLSDISVLHTYTKDYIVHYENKHSDNLLFLTSGLAKAYKIDKHNNEIFLYYIYKDSMLSEISDISANSIISFSNIEIIEDATILNINYKKFYEYFLDNNILSLEFAKEVIKRTKKIEALINREFVFDSVAKVAMMISSDLDMFNKLKRHDISLILHIQPATLSRVLNRLKRNQIIDIIHGKVAIIDKVALETIYEDLVYD